MFKKLYFGCTILLLLLCSACNKQSVENSEVEVTETQSKETVVGESGKRYEFDHSDSMNTEDTSSGFGKYSKLQDVLNDIITQTNDN